MTSSETNGFAATTSPSFAFVRRTCLTYPGSSHGSCAKTPLQPNPLSREGEGKWGEVIRAAAQAPGTGADLQAPLLENRAQFLG